MFVHFLPEKVQNCTFEKKSRCVRALLLDVLRDETSNPEAKNFISFRELSERSISHMDDKKRIYGLIGACTR